MEKNDKTARAIASFAMSNMLFFSSQAQLTILSLQPDATLFVLTWSDPFLHHPIGNTRSQIIQEQVILHNPLKSVKNKTEKATPD